MNDWEGTTYYICQTAGRDLWHGLEKARTLGDPTYVPKPWPYPVNPDCRCENCIK